MFAKLDEVVTRFEELESRLADPDLIININNYKRVAQEHAELKTIVTTYRILQEISQQIEDNKELLNDDDQEMRELAREELATLKKRYEELSQKLRLLMLPKDPRDQRNVFIEIRAGTGGDEAALFAAALFRMYTHYAENKGWKTEIMNQHQTEIGGFKEVIAAITGKEVFSHLKYEAGVHRVQRVPVTESQGRIHTSAVTVAIMPEADEVEIQVEDKDLKIDVFRSSGPGGQSVNTTDSAVRITHLPTGLVVICQDEKSQHKNKAKALRVLKARLYDKKVAEQQEQLSADRRLQVGSGDRSERIRTYNYPQSRVSDHRIGLTLYKLEAIMDGDLEEVILSLRTYFQAEALKSSS